MTNDDSIKTDALDVIESLRHAIADGELIVTGYSIARQRRKFVYTIEVEEPFEAKAAD